MPNSDHNLMALFQSGTASLRRTMGMLRYRAMIYGGVVLALIALVSVWGAIALAYGLLIAVAVLILAGAVCVVWNHVHNAAHTLFAEAELAHAFLINRNEGDELPLNGNEQVVWGRQSVHDHFGSVVEAEAIWHLTRKAFSEVSAQGHSVDDAMPAWRDKPLFDHVRPLLHRSAHCIALALLARQLEQHEENACLAARESIQRWHEDWDELFALNLRLLAIDMMIMLIAVVAGLVLFAVPALLIGSFSTSIAFLMMAALTAVAVKKIIVEPILIAAALECIENKKIKCDSKALKKISPSYQTLKKMGHV